MKKLFVLCLFVCLGTFAANLQAQQVPAVELGKGMFPYEDLEITIDVADCEQGQLCKKDGPLKCLAAGTVDFVKSRPVKRFVQSQPLRTTASRVSNFVKSQPVRSLMRRCYKGLRKMLFCR